MEIIDVDDRYIEWLRETFPSVLDPKVFHRVHSRKYLGVLFHISKFNYFAPFSSPKRKDFKKNKVIKKDNIFSLKMVKDSKKGKELLGTIKLLNMIPIPNEYLIKYDIAKEKDKKYKRLLLDEMKWINKNQDKILKNARTLYYFKKNEVKNRNVKNERLYNAILPFELIEFHLRYFLNKKWFIH